MPTPSAPNPISMQNVKDTLNERAVNYPTNLISFNDPLVRALAGRTLAGSDISMSNMHDKGGPLPYGTVISQSCTGSTLNQILADGAYGTFVNSIPNSPLCRVSFTFTVSQSQPNMVLSPATVINGYVAGKTDLTLNISTNVWLYGQTAREPTDAGIRIKDWHPDDKIFINNFGFIIGHAGDGGSGGNGENGGPAISIQCPITISINNASSIAYIAGGGGGGGGARATSAGIKIAAGGGGGAGSGSTGGQSLTPATGSEIPGQDYIVNSAGFYGKGSNGSNGPGNTTTNNIVSKGGGAGGGGGIYAEVSGGKTVVTGAGGGLQLPGDFYTFPPSQASIGGTGAVTTPATAGNGGSVNNPGSNPTGTGTKYLAGGGGGGWGASGGNGAGSGFTGITVGTGGAGGKAVAFNGHAVNISWVSNDTSRVYGAVG